MLSRHLLCKFQFIQDIAINVFFLTNRCASETLLAYPLNSGCLTIALPFLHCKNVSADTIALHKGFRPHHRPSSHRGTEQESIWPLHMTSSESSTFWHRNENCWQQQASWTVLVLSELVLLHDAFFLGRSTLAQSVDHGVVQWGRRPVGKLSCRSQRTCLAVRLLIQMGR